MKNVLENSNLLKSLRIGEIVEGKIIAKARSAVYLGLGQGKTGIIFGREYQMSKTTIKDLNVGDSLFAKITELENDEGYVELSVNQAGRELAWEVLKQKKEKDEIVKVKISGANKGGLLTEVSGIPAFLPVSQLMPEHYPKVEGGDTSKIFKELQKFIGTDLEVKIFDFSQKDKKLILSEKIKEAAKIKEVLKNYNVGDIVKGEITGLVDFGAFMKFGPENLEGLIHISELDWQLIESPAEIVKIGEKVKAKIIDISGDKISLSLKALKEDPWSNIENEYKKGDKIEGKASKFNPFGAFIHITSDIQGLCHISEFGSQKKMQEKLIVGKKYKFEILLIKSAEHRMSLRLVEE